MRLLTVPADGGPPTELAPDLDRNVMVGAPAYPGAPPRVRADGTVLFCGRDGGCTHAYRVPLAGGTAEKVVGGETRSVYGMSAASDSASDTFAFIAASPQSPSEVWVTTIIGNDRQQQLTSFTASALPDADLFPAERRTFTAPDGLTIEGWLIRDPAAPAPGPLLLDVHGGPHNAWGPAFDGIELHHQELARRGWTVLLVNARGSDGYGEAFYRALTGRWGRADSGDFLAAVDAVVAEGLADDRRVAVSGYSYGGYMTCWLTTQTNRFTAAVAGGCVANLTSFVGTSDMGPRIALELGALPFEDPARYADLSPISHVADVRTPTLVLHGDADLRCPLGQAEEWFSALRLRGQEVALVRYPGGDHLLQVRGRPSHRVDYSQRLADWVCGHDAPTVQT
jgi:dipeptidyl aminopeptidase/acylaminoacyl peptidase